MILASTILKVSCFFFLSLTSHCHSLRSNVRRYSPFPKSQNSHKHLAFAGSKKGSHTQEILVKGFNLLDSDQLVRRKPDAVITLILRMMLSIYIRDWIHSACCSTGKTVTFLSFSSSVGKRQFRFSTRILDQYHVRRQSLETLWWYIIMVKINKLKALKKQYISRKDPNNQSGMSHVDCFMSSVITLTKTMSAWWCQQKPSSECSCHEWVTLCWFQSIWKETNADW